jgi:hypothetical protein
MGVVPLFVEKIAIKPVGASLLAIAVERPREM